jgi:hypothetical protein
MYVPLSSRIGKGRSGRSSPNARGMATLIIPQHMALPFRRLAAGTIQPGPWHRDPGLPECARQRANPASMPMARNNCRRQISTVRMAGAPAITRARQSRIKIAANHLLDQSANLPADHVFDRIKPMVERWELLSIARCRRSSSLVTFFVVSSPAPRVKAC